MTCRHRDVDWDDDLNVDAALICGAIAWDGTCLDCGTRVREEYQPTGVVYTIPPE